MSARAVPEQHRRAGSSSRKAAGPSESGLPSLSLCDANASGYRGDEHDSEGTSQMVAEERHRGAGRVRWTPLRTVNRVIAGPPQPPFRLDVQVCNTTLLNRTADQ